MTEYNHQEDWFYEGVYSGVSDPPILISSAPPIPEV